MKKAEQTEAEGSLVHAAKTIGSAAGKLASLAGAHAEAPPAAPHSAPKAKFEKKQKHRLPRKLKKANAKQAAAAS